MTIEEKIKAIAEHYGDDAQGRQCIEECAELIQAINKFWRRDLKYGQQTILEIPVKSPCLKNIVEELADVQIMLWQMQYLLNADIQQIIEQKLDRQIERIAREENSNT